MRVWGIRWRLTLWNAAILAALFGLFCMVMLYLVHGHLQSQADQWMTEELHELNEDVNLTHDTAHLQQRLEKRYAVHAHLHFRILTEEGKTLFLSRFLTNITLPIPSGIAQMRGPRFEDVELGELGDYRLLSMAMRDGESRPLLLQVVAPKTALAREFDWYLGTVLAAIPIALLVAIATGYGLARQALSPVDQMVATAERISVERLDQRLVVRNSKDELGRLAITLNAMFDRLHRSVDQMRRFTSDAAHELRSPIAALRTEAEVMLRSPREPEVYRRVVQQTADEATRLTELVNQLLTLSRHDAGQVPPLEETIRVDLVLLDVVERFRSRAAERQIALETGTLPAWLLIGDDILLSQLFYNLIDNALKYTLAGGTVRVWGHVYGSDLVIGVQDTGIGISDVDQRKIFERFYRVDPSQNGDRGGAGLGLSICRAIVETHRGQIEVASVPGEGSCFQITLPGQIDRDPLLLDDGVTPLASSLGEPA